MTPKRSSPVGQGQIRRRLAGLLALTTVVALTLVGASTAQAARPVAHPWANLPVGTVVAQMPAVPPGGLGTIATATGVEYISTTVAGQHIVVSGMVLTPKVRPAGQRNIVAWSHGSTGLADQCAPSRNASVFWPEAVDAVRSYLERGWTVAATDYEGLGTPGPHPYMVGESEARGVIDSVRAARQLDPTLSSSWVATGHSYGGQAALFTGEIVDTYGAGLDLRAVVGLAPVSNLDLLGRGAVGTPANGYVVMALQGMAAVDSSVNIDAILAPPAKLRLPVTTAGCLTAILDAYAPLTATDMVVGGVLADSVLATLAKHGNPGQQASAVPVLLVQGLQDELIPQAITHDVLQNQVCSYPGTRSLYYEVSGGHDTVPTNSAAFVAGYIADRFAGQPAPSNC